MKIRLITIAKSEERLAKELFDVYLDRINRYSSIEHVALKASGRKDPAVQIKEEGILAMKKIQDNEEILLLDGGGKQFSSVEFSEWLRQKMNASRNLCFVIGGAYGFDEMLKKKASLIISLSKMTFPHQLAKVIFAEQLYRAFTIIRNEKYHH